MDADKALQDTFLGKTITKAEIEKSLDSDIDPDVDKTTESQLEDLVIYDLEEEPDLSLEQYNDSEEDISVSQSVSRNNSAFVDSKLETPDPLESNDNDAEFDRLIQQVKEARNARFHRPTKDLKSTVTPAASAKNKTNPQKTNNRNSSSGLTAGGIGAQSDGPIQEGGELFKKRITPQQFKQEIATVHKSVNDLKREIDKDFEDKTRIANAPVADGKIKSAYREHVNILGKIHEQIARHLENEKEQTSKVNAELRALIATNRNKDALESYHENIERLYGSLDKIIAKINSKTDDLTNRYEAEKKRFKEVLNNKDSMSHAVKTNNKYKNIKSRFNKSDVKDKFKGGDDISKQQDIEIHLPPDRKKP